MRAVRQANRRRSAGNFLHRYAMGEVAEPGAAPFFLDRDAEQPERAELWPQLARESVGAIDLLGARRDLVLGEVAHRVAEHVDTAAKPETGAGWAVPKQGSLRAGPSAAGFHL